VLAARNKVTKRTCNHTLQSDLLIRVPTAPDDWG
jgi:hypothetical protein